MGALSSTSPIQNSAESPTGQNELNDNKITVETTPKPRKFFKSRNSAPAEIQQQITMQQQQQQTSYQQHQQQSYQNHHSSQHETSGGDDDEPSPKRGKKKKVPVKREKVEKPPKPPKPEKIPKPKREKKVTVKESPQPVSDAMSSEPETSPVKRGRAAVEPTRSSGRSRAKCVNYNEDAGEDEFYNRIDRRVVPRHLVPATIASPQEEPAVEAPPAPVTVAPPQQSPVLHPPIVLRISKVSANICFVIT